MTITQSIVLVVEDEERIRAAVADALRDAGATVCEAGSAAEAMRLAAERTPDLFVVDLGLPDRSGVDLCHDLRRATSAPIIILSARASEGEKVALLRVGADDYVTKPFSVAEFVARCEAQLRRARTPLRTWGAVMEIDGLTIDLDRQQVKRDGQLVRLSPTEWGLLEALVRHAGRTVTHQQLFDAVWKREFGNPQQYLRVYVTHLRRKIERDPALPRIVITEPGVGYRLARPADA